MPKAEEAEAKAEATEKVEEAEQQSDPLQEIEESSDSWEDGDVVEDETTEKESTDSEEAEESEEQSDDESSEDTEEETESEETTEEESVEEESKEESQEEDTTSKETLKQEQKRLNDEAAKRRIAEKKLREEQQARAEDARKSWLNQAKDEEELKTRQQVLAQEDLINQQSSLLQREFGVEISKASADLELSKQPEPVQEALAKSLELYEARYLYKDQLGRPVGVAPDAPNVYQYLKNELDSTNELTSIGAREQTKKKTAEKTRTVMKPSRTPKEKKVDPDEAAFDSEFYGDDE